MTSFRAVVSSGLAARDRIDGALRYFLPNFLNATGGDLLGSLNALSEILLLDGLVRTMAEEPAGSCVTLSRVRRRVRAGRREAEQAGVRPSSPVQQEAEKTARSDRGFCRGRR
jgi:hypothetical protein